MPSSQAHRFFPSGKKPSYSLRRADERGFADHGWLRSYHTFSFGNYFDPAFMGFRCLRVINEDRVAPGKGFPTHGHRDMEILSYVLEGALAHEDSLGTGSVIRPGDIQRMSAGTGVHHSEFNASQSEPVHFLQIWIVPDRKGIEPGYEQKGFSRQERLAQLRLIASRDGHAGSVRIQQDVRIFSCILEPGQSLVDRLPEGRYAWIQVARGVIGFNGFLLGPGDGVALQASLPGRAASSEGVALEFQAPLEGEGAEFLLFDLP